MPMFSATTTLAGQQAAEALAEAVEALAPVGVGHFEVEDGSGLFEVGAHFEEAPDGVALDLLAAAFGARPFVLSQVPDIDWVAHVRRELSPVQAGRFFVYGAHDADKVPAGRIALLIEASMAFGTGHHGTTLGCLRAVERLAASGRQFDRVADIGCGTAVLAMAAARVWPAAVIAGDIDPVAVEVARANVAANDLSDRVAVVEAAGFSAPALAQAAPFDLIFANILKGPLVALAPGMADHAASEGVVILSGILNEQAKAVEDVYFRAGFNPADSEVIGDWTTLIMARIS